jgi:glycosyltransferase involved in cell wall biosynthesis
MSVYNGADFLSQSIKSILRQTFLDFEFIIVDDASTDSSYKIMQDYARSDERIVIIKNPSNLGLAQSLNIALNHASGNFIARMDSDDIAVENRLETQLKYLEENPDIVLVGSSIYFIDTGNNIILKYNTVADSRILQKMIYYQNICPHPTWMLKREILQNLKGYRNLPAAQDYDFLMRLCFLNYKISNINTPLLYYRVYDKSISYEKNLIQIKLARYLRKLYKKGLILDDGFIQKEQIKKVITSSRIAQRMHDLSLGLLKHGNSLLKNKRILSYRILLFLCGLLSPYMAYSIYCGVRSELLLIHSLKSSIKSGY